jgi:hypothetical protein
LKAPLKSQIAVTKQLEAERSTAENIKSKQTRTAVIDAIDMIIRALKSRKQTPPKYEGTHDDILSITYHSLLSLEYSTTKPPYDNISSSVLCNSNDIISPS